MFKFLSFICKLKFFNVYNNFSISVDSNKKKEEKTLLVIA